MRLPRPLPIIVLLFFLPAVVVACSEWSADEKENSQNILLAFKEVQEATRISNSGPSPAPVPPADLQRLINHYEAALSYAMAVEDKVLGKVHPEIRPHWRGEFEQGLHLRLINFHQGDTQAEIEGSALMDRFGDWWDANKDDIKIPK